MNGQTVTIYLVLYIYYMYANLILILGLNTYIYAFMNLETRDAYRVLFEKIFKILGDIRRKPVRQAYQLRRDNSCGRIRTVTVNMCKKQAPSRLLICLIYVQTILIPSWAQRLPYQPRSLLDIVRTSLIYSDPILNVREAGLSKEVSQS